MSGVGMAIERMTCKQRTAALAYLTGYCYSLLQRVAMQSDNPAGAMEVHLAALAIASPEAADLVRKVGA